jgi:hypothetical protein
MAGVICANIECGNKPLEGLCAEHVAGQSPSDAVLQVAR